MEQDYKEIDLIELIKYVLKFWWLIVLLTVVAAGLSYYITTQKITPTYEASTTLFVGKESSSITDISLGDLQLGNQLVSDYKELIKTNQVTEKVISELGLLATPDMVKSTLNISTLADSRFMHVSYIDTDPAMATAIVNKFSDILVEKAANIVGVKNIQVVDYAKTPNAPVGPKLTMNVAIAGAVGFMLALFVVFLRMMLINTIEKQDELEALIGLPVLGVIPKFKGEAKS